jgi:thymidine kinase
MTVTSHDKTSIPAIYVGVHGLVDVLAWPDFKDSDVVVIDEAQFFIGCLATFVQIAVDIYKKHVVIVGLDSDANRKPFGDVLAVMSMADSIEKKTALCKRCGDGTAAIFTRSITHHAAQVTVGGADLYEAVCRKHFSQSAV